MGVGGGFEITEIMTVVYRIYRPLTFTTILWELDTTYAISGGCYTVLCVLMSVYVGGGSLEYRDARTSCGNILSAHHAHVFADGSRAVTQVEKSWFCSVSLRWIVPPP